MIVKYGIFKAMDRSFACPVSAPEQGEIVAAILPLQKRDPLGRFCFVIDSEGDTATMSKRFMAQIDVTTVILPDFKLLTHAQEQAKILQAVRADFIDYLKEYYEKSN